MIDQGKYLQELFLNHDSNHVIAFRLKSLPDLHARCQSICDGLSEHYTHVIVSREGCVKNGKTDKHLHGLIIDSRKDLPFKQYEQDLRVHLKTLEPQAIGNKHLYVKIAEIKKQLLKYTLKEGNFTYKGFSKEFVDFYHRKSAKKEDLKQKIMNNEDALLDGEIDYLQFQTNHVQIKVDHIQPLYRSHIGAYFQTFKVKSGTISAQQWVIE